MDNKKPLTVLFSGRFDPPHCGHFTTILQLSRLFEKVIVVVLDYPKRKTTSSYAKQVFDEIIYLTEKNIKVVINKIHFAKITKKEFDSFNCDVYASGNMEVLSHIDSLGIPTFYTHRAFEYEASRYILK